LNMTEPRASLMEPVDGISPADLLWAREQAAIGERKVVELLEERLACGPVEFLSRLSATLHMPDVTLAEMRGAEPALELIPYAEASRRACVALRSSTGSICVVLSDPYDSDCQDWIEERIRAPFRYKVGHRLDVVAFLEQLEPGLRAMDGIAADLREGSDGSALGEDLSIAAISETDSVVVRLVNSTLYDAIKAGASDIHLSATATGITLKYRVDGVLTPAEQIHGIELAEQVISRIKVMSELDIAERRVPQDGRFKARRDGREIDFRVSVMPSVFGEDAVLRILDKRALSDQLKGLTLDSLGFDPDMKERLRRLSAEPYGMLLVTGPTGSGKTTSLYAVLSEVNTGRDKIITIEDPVEYQVPGVLQIPVNEQKGLTFARGLRSILRHDPDRIMVGEIRDPETAEIAVQSALTGHLVYTTLHANNVFDVIGRFAHMGVDLYNFASAVNAVLAQRLVRVLCPACRGDGCAHCRGTGYKGRKAIGELLIMTDELREMIVTRQPARKLKEAARAGGTVPLRDAATRLLEAGETTLEEINRVTFVA
jgi:general secretion pathway protein E